MVPDRNGHWRPGLLIGLAQTARLSGLSEQHRAAGAPRTAGLTDEDAWWLACACNNRRDQTTDFGRPEMKLSGGRTLAMWPPQTGGPGCSSPCRRHFVRRTDRCEHRE